VAVNEETRVLQDGRFDITASRPEHFGFGGGVHHCLGHFVARIDMATALPLLASRLRGPVADSELRFLPDSGNTGEVELPLRSSSPPDPGEAP
jgi:cytochrome P450